MTLFYGGPDQLMPVVSSLATACAFLFLFYNRLLASFNKLVRRVRRKPDPIESPAVSSVATPSAAQGSRPRQ